MLDNNFDEIVNIIEEKNRAYRRINESYNE